MESQFDPIWRVASDFVPCDKLKMPECPAGTDKNKHVAKWVARLLDPKDELCHAVFYAFCRNHISKMNEGFNYSYMGWRYPHFSTLLVLFTSFVSSVDSAKLFKDLLLCNLQKEVPSEYPTRRMLADSRPAVEYNQEVRFFFRMILPLSKPSGN